MALMRSRGGHVVATGKLIVMADSKPWTGVGYTTREGARHEYQGGRELLEMIARITGWTGYSDVDASAPCRAVPQRGVRPKRSCPAAHGNDTRA